MANNVFQAKRTTVAGRTPNTTASHATNSQYIAAGEFALNMEDRILYSSNGSTVITVGANLVNQSVTGNLTVKAIIANNSIGTAGYVLTSNSTGVYWASPTEGGAGNGTMVRQQYTADGVETVYVVTSGYVPNYLDVYVNGVKLYTGTEVTVTNGSSFAFVVPPPNNALIEVVGLTVTSMTANLDAQHIWTNTHTFNNTVFLNAVSANGTLGSAGQVFTSNGTDTYWSTSTVGTVTSVGSGDGLTGGAITAAGTLSVLANNGITANSTGLFVTQGDGVVVNATGVHVNATHIGTLTANNTSFVGAVSAANVVSNAQLQSNLAAYQTSAGLAANVATLTANNATNLGGVAASGYQTTAGLAANVVTLTANLANYVVANNGITSNATGVYVTQGDGVVVNATGVHVNTTYIGTLTANNAAYLGGTAAAGYQTTAGLAANVATLTANDASYLGGTAAAGYQTTAGLAANVLTLTANNANFVKANNGITSNSLGVFVTQGDGLVVNATGVHVNPNSGIVANATGVYVNAAYIGTLTANDATNLGGVAASGYQTTAGLAANVATLTANNATNLGGVAASGYQTTAGLAANVLTLTANLANYVVANNGITSNATGVYVTQGDGLIVNATGVHVRANSGIIANATGVFVNPNTGIVANATGVYVNAVYINTISSNSSLYANSSVSNLFTVGTSVFFVANGNVGIGNSTPADKLSVTGMIKDDKGDVRDIPVVAQTAVYQLSSTDNGKVISTTANVTVNGAVLTIAEPFTIFNNSAASITIVSGTGVTMYLAGTASTGNRTLAQRGIATVLMVAANTFVAAGTGLT